MRLTVLGSGSPEASIRRASAGHLLEVGGDTILFDCGGGVFDNLLRSGRKPSDVTHLIFSHLHSDHMIDYPRLVHAAWDEGGAPLKMVGPAPLAAIHEGYFGPNGVLAHDLKARTELPASQAVWTARGGAAPRPWPRPAVAEIAPGDAIDGADWRITSCAVAHAQPFLECMAFAVDYRRKKVVYSGDAGYSDALKRLCAGADLLLHWCYRLEDDDAHPSIAALTPTPSEIGRMAAEAGVKRLLLTHFRVHMDAPAKLGAARDALRRTFPGPSGVAEDLDIFEIG